MGDLYNEQFFRDMSLPRFIARQERYGEALARALKPESIIEFGCGLGAWLLGARKAGVKKVLGLEYGIEDARQFLPEDMAGFIEYGDLSLPIARGVRNSSINLM